MTRFLKFINENLDDKEIIENIISKIKRDCMPWIKESHGLPFYRGMVTASHPKELYVGSTIDERKPRDIKPEISKILDEWFLEHFGWKARTQNSLFATRYYNDANGYSPPGKPAYLIFPIGDIKYLYSHNVTDLMMLSEYAYRVFYKNNSEYFDSKIDDISFRENGKEFINYKDLRNYIINNPEELNKFKDFIFKEMDKFKYTDKDIYTATHQEVMIQCKHYYYIEAPKGDAFTDELLKRVKDLYNS